MTMCEYVCEVSTKEALRRNLQSLDEIANSISDEILLTAKECEDAF
jgi:hypothetical protein